MTKAHKQQQADRARELTSEEPVVLASALVMALIRSGTATHVRLARHVELVVDILVREIEIPTN